MQFLEGVRLAWEQIRSQKLKSFFSLLGVIVGVMFLIVVVSIVEGMDQYIRGTLTERFFGVNTVTVNRTPRVPLSASSEQWRAWNRAPRLTFEDYEHLRERVSLPVLISPESDATGELESNRGRKVENVRIVGAGAEIFDIRNWNVEQGRAFTRQEADRGVPVLVLGNSVAEVLFGATDPVGQRVRIRGFPYRVVGVLEDQGSFFGQSLNNFAVGPVRSPLQSFTAPRGRVDQILLKAGGPELVIPLWEEVVEVMRVRRRLGPGDYDNFAAETTEESLTVWERISQILFMALPGLVGISLVVGGIVIMNIMLVSVMERTREIGVRKALGARRADILAQVLIESGTLSGIGALFGVAIGVAVTVLVGAVSPLPAVVAPRWVLLGVSLGVVVGIVSGVYPASRAARLDPVDALRYE